MAGLLQRLKSLSPGLMGVLSDKFSSKSPQYRHQIRGSLASQLQNLTPLEKSEVLDLSRTPGLHNWSVSISHCQALGGWVAKSKPSHIGFDLEVKSRIEPKLVQRIATPKEISAAPDPSYIWCAKESYYKYLEKAQPVTFTELQITDWLRQADQTWTFSMNGAPQARGFLLIEGDLLAALAVSI